MALAKGVFRIDNEQSYDIYMEKNGRYYVTHWMLHRKLGIYEPSGTHRIAKDEYERMKEKYNG